MLLSFFFVGWTRIYCAFVRGSGGERLNLIMLRGFVKAKKNEINLFLIQLFNLIKGRNTRGKVCDRDGDSE